MSRARLLGQVMVAACVTTAISVPATAQSDEPEEVYIDRLHSDLPLYTFEWEFMWPRNFYAEDSFGCTTRVAWGDWEFRPDAPDGYADTSWFRFENYGVFHCAANLHEANQRDELERGDFSRGFFVRIGNQRHASVNWELWAFQQGMVPGSDYMLLARPSDEGLIQNFRVLQRQCPRGTKREIGGLDVWSTRYCAINSRTELLSLARKMLRRPPLGVLERMGNVPEGAEAEEEAPAEPADASTE